VVTNKVADLII